MYRKLITVKSLSYNYPHCGNPALDNLCFEIHAGERLALLGANGSGKSTLLGCISGLLSPPPHTIHIYDGDLSTLDPSNEGDLEKIRLRIAVVLQNPDAQIISSIVEEDTAFGPENLGLDKVEIRKRVDAALRRAGLEQYRKRQARFLSGGERQRLALAGALALDAKLIALDEAMSMLDPLGRDDFLALLDELAGAGKTIVQVTHSLEEALCCNRALVLYQGRIVFDGLPQELLNREELETWGFALPEQVKLFRLFRKETQSDCLAFTVDAAQAADNIAVAMKALPQNIQAEYDGTALNTNNNLSPDSVNLRNLNHGVTRSFWYEKHLSPPCNSVELRGENSLKNAALHMEPAAAPAVAFINASHKYSGVFPGGMSNMNFEIPRGQFIALIGRSGSGKSTALKHTNALLLPTEGNVLVLGEDTQDRKTKLSSLRMKAALSPQSPESALFENYVADDVAFGPRNCGLKGKALVDRVQAAMEKAGLPFGEFADRRTGFLSGGEKRRVAIAGTAAMGSEILLLDEALTSLDGFNQKKILDLIESFRKAGKTVIISTHSMETAALADQIGIMAEGKLAAFGSPREIFGCRWDPSWGLSLPWIVSVSRHLSALGLLPPEAVPFTSEELLGCLQGTPVPESKQAVSVNSGQPFFPKTDRSKRRKTGIEFFRMPLFEELPPASSPLQNMNGGLKLFLLLLFAAAALILPPPFFPLGILAATITAGWFFGKIGPGRLLRGFFRILPWLLIVCGIQLAYHFHFMRPLALILRIGTLSTLLSLFCAVTPLREFIGTFNRLFSFFARFGFPARDFSLAMGIALRFIPILSEEAENIVCAQFSRGGKKGRVRMAVALAVPLFLRALERADALAKAMTLRCYRRGKLHGKRKKMEIHF